MVALWERMFQKKKLPKYRFQNSPVDDVTWVQITDGRYSSVVFSYGTVRFSWELDIPKLQFSYNILHSGNHDPDLLKNDQEFVTMMGDILTEIIIANEPIRTNNPQESDLQ
jgi:hypothetical protein